MQVVLKSNNGAMSFGKLLHEIKERIKAILPQYFGMRRRTIERNRPIGVMSAKGKHRSYRIAYIAIRSISMINVPFFNYGHQFL
jgi:hypothetical protein